ncbi:hypothetical protein OQA88_3596 [Cercophora sp. LCS_1]
MAPPSAPKAPPPLTSSPYPYATAPDIIRAHQKDAYFEGVLTSQITDLHRRLRGARSAHAWSTELTTLASLLYHSLTTLLGNRTLGEEYCDLIQVESTLPLSSNDSSVPVLPGLPRRSGYIATSILLPYLFSRIAPRFRSVLRSILQARLATLTRQGHGTTTSKPSPSYRFQRYLLAHLSDVTSGAHFHAIILASFYFTGAYYSLSKRLWGLRYVFTRQIDEGAGGRAGYEVLGVLLVVQMVVRGWMHLRNLGTVDAHEADVDVLVRERAFTGADVSLDENAYSRNNELLVGSGTGNQRSLVEIGVSTHTPVVKGGRARYDLGGGAVMGWIKGGQQRKCTLCLEEMKDPAATQCGHVFCWVCIGDWVREKPECPLCRRESLVQHILPLRSV